MRRVVLLVSSISGGGAERVAATLANAWSDRGFQVFLVPTFMGSQGAGYGLRPEVCLLPLSDSMPAGGIVPSVTLGKIVALRTLVESLSPDMVVSFLANVNVMAILALRRLKVPLVICERVDLAAGVELPWALRVARKMLYRFADALVVQTADAAVRFRARIKCPSRVVVIPNPLPASLHLSDVRAHVGNVSRGHVVAMGRLTPQKRFDRLIHAFAKAFHDDPAWTLTIWGDGPLRDALQALIDDLHLAPRVILGGLTNDPWSALAVAQIFALPSDYEGFPNAMLEAMALGLPCVVSDCPSGPGELALAGEAAVLVPPGDVDLLADALRKLARDPERRMHLGRLAAQSVRNRFSEESVIARWDEFFGTLRSIPGCSTS